MPPWVVDALGFLQAGVASNWFGLACPAHCRGWDLGALLASFLLGVVCASLAAAWLLFCTAILPGPLPVPPEPAPEPARAVWFAPPASSLSRRRLQGYRLRGLDRDRHPQVSSQTQRPVFLTGPVS